MNKRQILAALALAFALGLAAPVAIYADETTPEQSSEETAGENTNEGNSMPTEEMSEETPVSENTPAPQATNATVTINTDDVAALKSALEDIDNSEVILDSDITVSSASDLDITRSDSSEVTLNLNGHKITTANQIRVINLRKGHFHIKGGTIESTYAAINSKAVVATYGSATPITVRSSNDYYTFVIIDNDVTITSNGYGVAVYDEAADGSHTSAAYGVSIAMNGKIVAPYGMSVSGNITQGNVNQGEGVYISLGNGSSITSTLKDANGKINDGTGIYAPGNAQWSIGSGSTIEAGTGIEAKAGIFYITGATIKASGPAQTGTPQMGLADDTGAVFQIESNSQYNGVNPVAFYISSGTFSSENNSVFYQYGDDDTKFDKIEVYSGSFTSGANKPVFAGVGSDKVNVYGGNYYGAMGLGENSLPENYEYVTETDANGNTYTKVVYTGTTNEPGQGAGGDETEKAAGADEEAPETGAFGAGATEASNLTTSVISMLASVMLASGIAFVASKHLRRAGDKKN